MERFWCLREGAYALDNDGFLRDPDTTLFGTQSANPGVLRTDDLREPRCLVLLGEPGAGKSTAVQDGARLVAAGVPVVPFDLAAYGSEGRLVREVFDAPAVTDWARGSGQVCLLLDSLDEARTRVPHVGAVIAERLRALPSERLFLRLACRTADWPAGLEQALTEAFGDVTVVEILPLRRSDAAAIATTWCDPSAFVHEVERAGAGPLAARPLTLRFLARTFGESGALPERGAALYSAGVRSLCEEQNVARRDAGLHGMLSRDERVAIARRIAVATVFGGASALWLGAEVDAGAEDVSADRLSGAAEPTGGGTLPVTAAGVREAARTGLFTSRGGQRLGWAHATFADFLAAEWVVANNLSVEQARPLFLGPDGRCWPQTRLAAAWAVAIAPERFTFLTAADPAAFQGEVELPGDALRAAVIDGLFSVAGTLTTAPWERSYHALRHRDVAEQLRPRLRDPDVDRRRLALELARECAAVELRDDLVAIALDRTAETHDRVAAAWSLTEVPDSQRTAALRSLALDAAERGDDPADELKGVALLASWPHAISSAEVFSVLTARKQRNLLGSYAMFLDRFRTGVTTADVGAGLQWLLSDPNGPAHDHTVGALGNRVLDLAATRPADPAVIDAFTRLVLARVEQYEGLMFEDFRHDERSDPLAHPALRRAVALSVLGTDPTDRVVFRLSERGLHSLGVVRAEDLSWLADLYGEAGGELRNAVRTLFGWTFDHTLAEHRDFVLGMPSDHPLHVDLVHTWTDPVALDSPEADQMRQSWGMIRGSEPETVLETDDVNEQIEELLDRFDGGEGVGFWYATRLLTVAPRSKHFGAEFDPDVVGMDRWPTMPEAVRERIVNAAERYLLSQPCEPEKWLDKPDIRFHPAEAGYRAMVLLLRVAPERLHQLPEAAWIEWAPVLASWSTSSVNGATWDDKLTLLQLAGGTAQDAVRSALLTHVEAAVTAGKCPHAANEAGYLWDETVAARYLALACAAEAEPRGELVATLVKHDVDLVRPLLLEWLADPIDPVRQRLAASQLIDGDLGRNWQAVKAAFDSDAKLADEVLGKTLTVRGYERFDQVDAAVLADIYLWLLAKFPPDTDPVFNDADMAHFVGPREQVGHWRDNLLTHLRDLGTPEAVDAVRAIVAARSEDRWLARTLATAEAALRRNQWSPTPLPQLLRLAEDRRNVLVNDLIGLEAAVVAALDMIQTRLTGATPESHYLWDTHSGRPKSEDEISDYLANELARELTARGAIVNREVQVRRNNASGIGERTDLLVDAAPVGGPSTGRLSLPVEVKGAWNEELLTAMQTQLVDRYMRDTASTRGIYIVAWHDLSSWTDTTDNRRTKLASVDRAAIEAALATQAAEVAQQGAQVQVVHLDVSYRRPEYGADGGRRP